MPDPISPPLARSSRAALVLVLSMLGGCGSATGELPSGRDLARPDGTPPGVFGDPTSPPGEADVATADTIDATPVGGASLPAPTPVPTPAPAFSDPVSSDPLGMPDPTAPTLLGRLGFVALSALAEPLVAARFVDEYLAVDADVAALVAPLDPEPGSGPETLSCPDGGRVRVERQARLRGGVLELAFEGCVFGTTTLSGALVRSTLLDGFRIGADEVLELDYGELVVGSDEGETTLSGTTRRGVLRRASLACDGEDVELSLVHRIDTADVTREGWTVQVVDARHALDRASVLSTPDGDRSNCRERTSSVFDGRASVSGGPFDTVGATIHRRGSLVRDTRVDREPASDATLLVASRDGSSFSLRLLSDRDATAQADVLDGDVAASFTVSYRFEP